MYFGSVFWYVLPVVSLLIRGNSIKIWTYFLLILILYFLFRIILAFIHHILIKNNILRYVADDLSYYGSSAREREKLNIDYKVKMDRYYASKAYIICQMLILGILTYFQNGDGIISSIIIAIILNLPLLILLREPTDYSIGSNNLSNTSRHQESGNKKKKQKSISDIDYKKLILKINLVMLLVVHLLMVLVMKLSIPKYQMIKVIPLVNQLIMEFILNINPRSKYLTS